MTENGASPTSHDASPGDAVGTLPYATGDVRPIGGRIKACPEDFLVEEIPAYQPSGEGEHIYLFVEKRELSTTDLVAILARHFGVRESAIGYAGMKDKHAVTRQMVSIHTPGRRPEDFRELVNDRVGVVHAGLHTNKLRLGHLRGNRFTIRIRDVDPLRVLDARRVLDRLSADGTPNFFGAQRFGAHGNNHEVGRLMLLGAFDEMVDRLLGLDDALADDHAMESRTLYAEGRPQEALDAWPISSRGSEWRVLRALAQGASPRDAVLGLRPVQLRFWISAFQARVFNDLLARRVEDGTTGTLEPGEVATKHANGAMFDVDEEVAGDPDTLRRLAAIEISPSGPIWGPKMKRASGSAGRDEEAALARTGVTPEAVGETAEEIGVNAPGDRRAYRAPLVDPSIEGGADEQGSYIRVAFDLPPGSFATMVMREIMKTDHPLGHAAGGESETNA